MSAPYGHRHKGQIRRDYSKTGKISIKKRARKELNPLDMLKSQIRMEYFEAYMTYQELLSYFRGFPDEARPEAPVLRKGVMEILDIEPSVAEASKLLIELMKDEGFEFRVTYDPISKFYIIKPKE